MPCCQLDSLFQPPAANYNDATGDWSVGALQAFESDTLIISALANAIGTNTFTAAASATQNDPDNTNNTASISTQTGDFVDLEVGLSISNNTPFTGETVTITVDVQNNGPRNGTGATATILLPSGYTFVSSNPSLGTYDELAGLWTIGAINQGGNETLTINATISNIGINDLNAAVQGTEEEANNANNTAELSVLAGGEADLEVVLTADNLNPGFDGQITFTITASNNGVSEAVGNNLSFLLPNGYTFVSSAASEGIYDALSGNWAVPNLTSGANATLQVVATVLTTGTYDVTANLNGGIADPLLANNSATLSPAPSAQVDLVIGSSFASNNVNVDENATLNIVLTNNGPSQATGVSVNIPTPAGYLFVSSDNVAYNGGTGTWNVGVLNNGGSTSLQIIAQVQSAGDYDYVSTATSVETELNAPDNTTTSTLVPLGTTDLEITLALDNPTPILGGTVTLTATVQNLGSSDATGIIVENLFASAYTYTSDVPSVGTYDDATGEWTGISLASGASATLDILMEVSMLADLNISAYTIGDQTDPQLSNNFFQLTPTASVRN